MRHITKILLLTAAIFLSTPHHLYAQGEGFGQVDVGPNNAEQLPCLCTKPGAVGTEAGFCVTAHNLTSCETIQQSGEFLDIAENLRSIIAEYRCQTIEASQFLRQQNPSDTTHLCPGEPYTNLTVAASVIMSRRTIDPANTPPSPETTNEETFVSITPQLGVPIPGLVFAPATSKDGVVEVPFVAQYIAAIQRYLLGLSLVAATIMVVYGGFLYLLGSASGDIGQGKDIITNAIIGLLIALGSYTILHIVNPNLLNLQPLQLSYVQKLPISDDAASDSAACGDDPLGCGPASFCRQTLVRTPRPGKRDVWCSACGCGVMKNGIPDNACLSLVTSCGGAYGQFLDALTGHCRGKTFGWLEGLDGGTFGILHYTENEFAGLIDRLQNKDAAAYARVIAAGGNAPVTNAALCNANQNDRGFVCNRQYRAMLEAALRERSFTLVQLEDSYNKYASRRRSAEAHGFHSAFGQAMWATVANNPGRCNSRTEGLFYNVIAACPAFQNGSENEKIECFLQKYVELGCRDGAPGAARRVQSIRENLAGLSRTTNAPLPDLAQLESCIPAQ